MSSIRRIISSKANGALSQGATTPEGKRRLALANMRHGLLARCVVVENESREIFDLLITEHNEFFQPANAIELGMVEDIACAYWRLRRAMAVETSMINSNLPKHETNSELERLEQAFTHLAETPKFNTLNRYEARLQRAYQRALRNLTTHRDLHKNRKKLKITKTPT